MSAHLIDSRMYGHLWSTAEMHELFDETRRLQSWLDILASLAAAQAELDLIPDEAADAIAEHASVELLDLEHVAAETRSTGHSTLGLIRGWTDVLPEHAREWAYYGATVQDVTDTWTALTMQRVGQILHRDLRRAEAAALQLAERHRDTLMSGRTHGQPGLPITFGFKAAVWASELRRHLQRLYEGRRRWEVVQLGGALGTLQFFGDDGRALQEEFAARVGLAVPDIPWLTARDGVAEFLSLLGMITGTLAKIGTEVYDLQRAEIAELSEPFDPERQVSSITMPHKRNPEVSEHLVTLSRLVRRQADVGQEGLVNEHERDGRSWKAEWIALPEACILTGTALEMGCRLLEGLEIHAGQMRENLRSQAGYVLSEPVMRALARHVGKKTARRLVQRAAMDGLERGVSLREALLDDPDISQHLEPSDIDACLDPAGALGAVPDFIDRVLEDQRRTRDTEPDALPVPPRRRTSPS